MEKMHITSLQEVDWNIWYSYYSRAIAQILRNIVPFSWSHCFHKLLLYDKLGGSCSHDRMVIGLTKTCAFSAYHYWICEFESHSWRGVLDTALCDKVCQWPLTGRWFFLGNLVSSTNKTDCHDISEILLKVALNTTALTLW